MNRFMSRVLLLKDKGTGSQWRLPDARCLFIERDQPGEQVELRNLLDLWDEWTISDEIRPCQTTRYLYADVSSLMIRTK
jgi:hypothetical protein